MKRSTRGVLIVVSVLVAASVAWFAPWDRTVEEEEQVSAKGDKPLASGLPAAQGSATGANSIPQPSAAKLSAGASPLEKAISGYDALASSFRGKELEEKRCNYLVNACADLEAADVCRLIDHGSPDLGEESLKALSDVIRGAMSTAVYNTQDLDQLHGWMKSVENPYFKEHLLKKAGDWYSRHAEDANIADFLNGITSAADKDKVLAAFCAASLDNSETPLEEVLKIAPHDGGSPLLAEAIRNSGAAMDFSKLPSLLESLGAAPAPAIYDAVLLKWLDKDPSSAAEFISSPPDKVAVATRAALQRLLGPGESAIKLARNLPVSPEKDQMIAAAAQSGGERSPADSWQLGVLISNADLRAQILNDLYHRWSATDQAAADAARAAFSQEAP